MPRLVNKTPSYRHHKSDGRAVVTIDGQDVYLGKYNSPESRAEYDRLISVWLAGGRRFPTSAAGAPVDLTVNELILAFWRHAEDYYRRADGTPTAELDNLRLALRPLKQLFGGTPARDFDPLTLKTVRQSMVDAGLCRRTINQRVARVVRVFQHAAENKLLPPDVYHGLRSVAGLRAGRSGAKEGRKVGPVPEGHVEAVRPYLSRQLWAVAELQRLSGMRSGEALAMRGCDLETSGDVWVYTPARHKTAHRGKRRWVPLGPRAQAVIGPWLRADPAEFLFQPREAKEEHLAGRREARRTPLTPSQRARTRKGSPSKAPGERYDTRTYNHAVARACEAAGVPRWHPHQLRHSAATNLRKEFGIEVARVILGHSSPAVTEVYAEVDRAKAVAAMAQVG